MECSDLTHNCFAGITGCKNANTDPSTDTSVSSSSEPLPPLSTETIVAQPEAGVAPPSRSPSVSEQALGVRYTQPTGAPSRSPVILPTMTDVNANHDLFFVSEAPSSESHSLTGNPRPIFSLIDFTPIHPTTTVPPSFILNHSLFSAAFRPPTPEAFVNLVPEVQGWNARTSHTIASRASPAVAAPILCHHFQSRLSRCNLLNLRCRVWLLLLVDRQQ